MNSKEYAAFEAEQERKQAKVKASYIKRGFVKDENEYMKLHMAFSPYKVPCGLTKLKVRRRVNAYEKGKRNPSPLFANRIEIYINDRMTAGGSFTSVVPNSHRGLQNLVKALLWK